MNPSAGKVIFVGAGPGDPGLVTVRGAEALGAADVVLYDYLASPHLLAAAPRGAELVCLGRHGYGRLMTQTEINDAMIRHARAGRTVVRLKGGDPGIFGRLAEELRALESAGIDYETVPGVTAAQAASSYAGIPLTQRDEASCVALVAGRESQEKEPALDFSALAKFPGTLVFYMGVTSAPAWSHKLLEHGKPADTPVAVVRRCSLPDQQTIVTTLGELPARLRQLKLRPPAVIVVGEVVGQARTSSWFTERPLFGQTVLVARPERQSHDVVAKLHHLGANVLCQPAIEIGPPADWAPVDAAIGRLDDFDWLVFSSTNGVQYFMQRLFALGYDVRRLSTAKIAAIGPATADALAAFSVRCDLQPAAYRAEALAEALAPHVRGRRVFLARASRGREVLAEALTASGAVVEQVVVYESLDVAETDPEVADMMAAGRIDWTIVTSSAIARSLVRLFGEALHKTRLAAISPLTAEVLQELGYPPAITAENFTTDGIIDALLVHR
jgi:uroporphyrinogen III methyltransferase/synthase